ncbi:unnamed protein product [Agarophyton chilense]
MAPVSMDTSTVSKEGSHPPVVKLPPLEEEKISHIIEICNVTRDEAIRVLDACHMDETMAIERFLSGNEVSTWSEVSKKKKPAPHSRSASGPKGGWNHSRPSDRDRDRDRRDRDRDRSFHSDNQSQLNGGRRGSRQHGQYGHHQRSKDSYSAKKWNQEVDTVQDVSESVKTETQGCANTPIHSHVGDEPNTTNGIAVGTWQSPQKNQGPDDSVHASSTEVNSSAWSKTGSSSPSQEDPWSLKPLAEDPEPEPEVKPVHHEVKSASPVRVHDSAPKQPAASSSTSKPILNYAAAAAAGTSHEKHATQAEKSPITNSSVTKAIDTEPPVPEAIGEVTVNEPIEASEPEEAAVDPSPSTAESVILEAPTSSPSAWSTPPVATETQSDKHLDESSTAVAVASAAVIGSEQNSGDSLSLQFGSFGLAGLDGVNWSTADQKTSEPIPMAMVTADAPAATTVREPSPPQTSAAAVSSTPVPPSVVSTTAPSVVPSAQLPASAPLDVSVAMSSAPEVRAPIPPSISAPISSGAAATGSGMFPMLQVGHGGSFPPPNYPNPYLVPSLHGYSPAIPSYDNSGELGSSRAPNLGPPGSMPHYDPASLPGMQSGTGKYGAIPGLGDISALQAGVQTGINKDGMHGGNSDVDKTATIGSSGLPSGMDPLAPPYLMAGYHSMQYPLYPFPTGPYGPPPGMAPGPNPFPYPTAGQVSSQGGRGGFGFDDASVGLGANSRNGSGLSESMYTPGGYLNTSMNHTNSQKNPNDGAYKPVRPNPGNSLGAMGMPGGIVHGMAYQDYTGGMPGVSSGVVAGGPVSWNNRQPNSGRADGGNGPGMNQSMPGASQNSSVYAAGPGAPNGYWSHQQGGYYS